MNILISNQEKQALMKKLDIDRDGSITEKEMFMVLSGSPSNGSPQTRLPVPKANNYIID
jgi:Ca2+-binding EF-hand superfamily protein